MTKRKYDLPAMQRYLDVLDAQINALAEVGGQVKTTAETLLGSYSGAGADGYSTAHGEWQKAAASLLEELRSHREQVATAHRNYTQAEAANRAMRG